MKAIVLTVFTQTSGTGMTGVEYVAKANMVDIIPLMIEMDVSIMCKSDMVKQEREWICVHSLLYPVSAFGNINGAAGRTGLRRKR